MTAPETDWKARAEQSEAREAELRKALQDAAPFIVRAAENSADDDLTRIVDQVRQALATFHRGEQS